MGCGLTKADRVCSAVVPVHEATKAAWEVLSRHSATSSRHSDDSRCSVLAPMPAVPKPPDDVPERYFKRERRVSYSSESTSADTGASYVTHPKSDKEKARLEQFLRESDNFLFASLCPTKIAMVVNAMFKKEVPSGTEVITQGSDDADNYYILDEGHCDIFVRRNGGPEEKVKEITPGKSFGELALLYMCPRAASVRTTIDSILWALGREQFRSLVVSAERAEKNQYEDFLKNIEVLSALNQYERMTLADALEFDTFDEGEDAIEQGDDADHLFILESGAAQAIVDIPGHAGPVVLKEYRTPGDVFGELALLKESKRNATVRCTEETTCLRVSRQDFEGLLGPIHDILRRNAELYVKYGDALAELPNRRYSVVRFAGSTKADDEGLICDTDMQPSPVAAARRSSVGLNAAATETPREINFRLQCSARQLVNDYYAVAETSILREMMASPAYKEQFPVETSYDCVSAKKRASRRRTKENIPDIIQESDAQE